MADMLKAFHIEDPGLKLAGIVDSHPVEVRRRLPEALSSHVPLFDSLSELVEKAKPDALV